MSHDAESDELSLAAALEIARTHVASVVSLTKYLVKHEDDSISPEAARAAETAARSLLGLAAAIVPDTKRASLASLSADAEALAESRAELAATQAELSKAVAERDDLQAALDRLQQRLDQVQLAHEREARALQERLDDETHRHNELKREHEEKKQELQKIQAKSDNFAAALIDREAVPPELQGDIDEAEAQFSVAGVIEMALEKCELVVIPEAALREIDALDADEKAADWARELWKGLRALNAYATESEHFNGGFWEWCEHSNHAENQWQASPKKLAMSESDTVKNSGPLWKARRFVVDTDVSPNGYQHMEAHLKITEGGGQHIPRLYFYDDAMGKTSKVHIGFIGPHRLVPTSHS